MPDGKTEEKINIEITGAGEVKAPEGMTPEQVAVMFPGAFGAATPEQIRSATRKEPRVEPPGGPVPDDWAGIDPRKRDVFEQHVFEQIGFNPILFDPYDYVNRSMSELPALFNYVFGGQIMWADRNKLNKEQLAYWQEAVKTFRAAKLREAQSLQERGMDAYNWMMNKFDKIAARKEKILEEKRKPPTTKQLWSEKHQAKTLHRWDPKSRKWIDTGRRASAPKKGMPPEVKDAWTIVKALAAQFGAPDIGELPAGAGAGGEVDEETRKKLQIINRLRGGKGKQMSPELRRIYDHNLNILLEYFGLSKTQPTDVWSPQAPQPVQPQIDKSWRKYYRKK